MKTKTYHSFIFLDRAVKERILTVMMYGNNKAQSIGFFRVTTGLYYLSKIMVEDELDFKAIDAEFNAFIFQTIGKGHSITSVLQYMSSKKVLWVLNSKSFVSTFLNYFSEIPFKNMLLFLTINLSVSKKISGLGTEGPLQEWIVKQGNTESGEILIDSESEQSARLSEE
ncbi:hypothetical protein BH11PSE11_BH11PSE11_31930 [soil metagenome]